MGSADAGGVCSCEDEYTPEYLSCKSVFFKNTFFRTQRAMMNEVSLEFSSLFFCVCVGVCVVTRWLSGGLH